eukprot:gb/GEZJ01004100.1/.p3 GENE.gb/GEZJ01004100.1/~~gb/GEZJ01004100.1/.p3  ORF type:complete len:112 (+),score=6.01 gb/GEZJ01004100.1/:466-801(+)
MQQRQNVPSVLLDRTNMLRTLLAVFLANLESMFLIMERRALSYAGTAPQGRTLSLDGRLADHAQRVHLVLKGLHAVHLVQKAPLYQALLGFGTHYQRARLVMVDTQTKKTS